MIVPPDKTLPAGQGISSAWIGICVKSEDCALGVPGPATDAPHARQQDKTHSDALVTCVKSEDCAQGVRSRGTCVKSEDCAQGDWSLASSATHHETDGHLPASGGEAPNYGRKKRTMLTADQAVDIFNHKKSKTAVTCSLLAQQYDISQETVRDIWNGKTWAAQTRPLASSMDAAH